MITFIDTNILIYLTKQSEPLHKWSEAQFVKCKSHGPVVVSDVVYAEFSAGMNSQEHTDKTLDVLGLEQIPITKPALFEAGRLFRSYKSRGGTKNNVLPDFFIAAQALQEDGHVFTANPRDFYKLIPQLQLILPPNSKVK